jgi:hypothetical protein
MIVGWWIWGVRCWTRWWTVLRAGSGDRGPDPVLFTGFFGHVAAITVGMRS